jgi:hypothetical protein
VFHGIDEIIVKAQLKVKILPRIPGGAPIRAWTNTDKKIYKSFVGVQGAVF